MVHSDQTTRCLIDAYGVDEGALREGFQWLVEQAQHSLHTDMALVVNGINNIKNVTGPLGAEASAQLQRDRKVDVGMQTLHAYSLKTLPNSFSGPVLAVHLDEQELD